MIEISEEELVQSSNGRLVQSIKRTINKISIDTRQLSKGDIFVAIKGERANGHEFVKEACKKGAACLIIDKDVQIGDHGVGIIKVDDTGKALADIARFKRRKISAKTIAITGSVGKTTTKEILTCILSKASFSVNASKGNFNNELGIPLTIINEASSSSQILILEMAMRSKGQIHQLCEIGQPNCGIITNIGKSHLGEFGSEKEIAVAKGELAQYLNDNDVLALNIDNPWTQFIKKMTKANIVTFGTSEKADIRFFDVRQSPGLSSFKVKYKGEIHNAQTDTSGIHIIENIAAAAAIAVSTSMELEEIIKAISSLSEFLSRQAIFDIGDLTVIDDTYNASPESTKKGLDILSLYEDRRRVAVLGNMAELGGQAESLHFKLGEYVLKSGVDLLITVGDMGTHIYRGARSFGYTNNYEHFETTEEAADELPNMLKKGDVVLVKGSRCMSMERIVINIRSVFSA